MSIADDLVAALQPWMTPDFEDFARAVGGMFAQVELYAEDSDTDVGWAIMLDPDNAPVAGLPYLAQYVGEQLPVGLDEAGQREWINDKPNSRRGTPESLARAAQRTLTGTRTVQILERTMPDGTVDPNGDHFTIITYTGETPNRAQVLANLLMVSPADMVLSYLVDTGGVWATFHTSYPTWNAVKAAYATWADMQGAEPGATVWTHD